MLTSIRISRLDSGSLLLGNICLVFPGRYCKMDKPTICTFLYFQIARFLHFCSSRTIVTTSLLTVIMLYVDAVPVVYRTMFTVPNIVLMNVMACRVFRHTKFGLLRECEISTSSLLKSKAGRPKTLPATQVSVPLSALRFQTGPGFTDTRQGLETQVVDGTTTGGSQGDVSPDGTEVKYSPYCGDRIV